MKTIQILVVSLLILVLSTTCNSSKSTDPSPTPSPSPSSPDKLQVTEHQVNPQQTTITYTVTDQSVIQQLYTTINALPGIPTNQICPAIAGPSYELTFFKHGTVVLKAEADRGGCGMVSLTKTDRRQPDQHFWSLLMLAMK
jgi:hypothetical protein